MSPRPWRRARWCAVTHIVMLNRTSARSQAALTVASLLPKNEFKLHGRCHRFYRGYSGHNCHEGINAAMWVGNEAVARESRRRLTAECGAVTCQLTRD